MNDPKGAGPSGTFRAFGWDMRFLRLYLIGYFVLLFGAVLALWQSGILRQIPGVWIAIGAVIAVGLGIILAVVSAGPVITTRE
jgi:hypothetical protein